MSINTLNAEPTLLDQLPKPCSTWIHRDDQTCKVLLIANQYTERHEEYPITVVYQDGLARIRSQPLAEWLVEARPLDTVQPAAQYEGCLGELPPSKGYPKPGSVWRHRNGSRYTVMLITNGDSDLRCSRPPAIVYIGENNNIWLRKASDWTRSMMIEPSA